MMRWGAKICSALCAAAFAAGALAQTPGDDLRDAQRPDFAASTPRPYSLWTPAALRTALLEGPLRAGGLPRGFAVRGMEVRLPSAPERAVGMAYRIDVILNGPARSQSITFRLYDTPDAARAAVLDKTLGDRGVTLTRESLETPMIPNGGAGYGGACARVRSAAFSDLVFMRCQRTVLDLPVIVSGAVGDGDYSLTDAAGTVDFAALQKEMAAPAALMATAAAQIEVLVAADPDGEKAYMHDMFKTEAAKPSGKKR
ncbi:MAG TPA: hypothetical protein VG983_11325 [Caulobacterales bacterium]|jgi:hypothetical protein|nr:hypothetical protein [Caulobacterales bacterium]